MPGEGEGVKGLGVRRVMVYPVKFRPNPLSLPSL